MRRKKVNIKYQIFSVEDTPLKDNSIDLIAIAQALHWFDFDRFYSETRRVLRKTKDGKTAVGGGIIAAWAYGLHTISPEVDKVTHQLYEDILGDEYWPPERKYVEERYEIIPFPFEQIPAPEFQIQLSWNLLELVNYYRSWSSVQKFIEKNKYDPISEVSSSLEYRGGGKNKVDEKRKVVWPLYVKIGKI